jgi:hypothetical protein
VFVFPLVAPEVVSNTMPECRGYCPFDAGLLFGMLLTDPHVTHPVARDKPAAWPDRKRSRPSKCLSENKLSLLNRLATPLELVESVTIFSPFS